MSTNGPNARNPDTKFRVVFRGYSREEVDEFLSQVNKQLDQMRTELAELRELRNQFDIEKQNLSEEVKKLKEELESTRAELAKAYATERELREGNARLKQEAADTDEILRAAHKAAEEMKLAARKESEQILKEADERVRAMMEESRKRLDALRMDYERARRHFEEFLTIAKSLAQSFLRKIEDLEPNP